MTTPTVFSGRINDTDAMSGNKRHKSVGVTVKCSVDGCEASFSSEKSFKRHVVGSHGFYRPHLCESPGCSYAAASQRDLGIHSALYHSHDTPKHGRMQDAKRDLQTYVLQRFPHADKDRVVVYDRIRGWPNGGSSDHELVIPETCKMTLDLVVPFKQQNVVVVIQFTPHQNKYTSTFLHREYSSVCDVASVLGNGACSVVWVNYNPDGYRGLLGRKANTSVARRHAQVFTFLQMIQQARVEDLGLYWGLGVYHFFYDVVATEDGGVELQRMRDARSRGEMVDIMKNHTKHSFI